MLLVCGMADERITGGRSGRVEGTDEEDMTVGGTAGLFPCEPCCDAAAGKLGESTIMENGFPVTKPVEVEAGADNGCRSYT